MCILFEVVIRVVANRKSQQGSESDVDGFEAELADATLFYISSDIRMAIDQAADISVAQASEVIALPLYAMMYIVMRAPKGMSFQSDSALPHRSSFRTTSVLSMLGEVVRSETEPKESHGTVDGSTSGGGRTLLSALRMLFRSPLPFGMVREDTSMVAFTSLL